MEITSKMKDSKLKLMVFWITKNMSTTYNVIIYIWNNQVKSIKINYHSINWLSSDLRFHIKDKDLVVMPKQEPVPDSEIAILSLKMPHSRIGHVQYWMGTVLLWLSYLETNNLIK